MSGSASSVQLTADPARSDTLIAAAAQCSRASVYPVRAALVSSGQIPPVPAAARTWRPPPRRLARARDRAVRVLIANPRRSDAVLGQAARVTRRYIAMVRAELEPTGQIERVPPPHRTQRRPRRPQPGRARTAILLGARTPAEVAAAAGITRQAAWQALRTERARPPLPKPPLPPVACEQCGRMFTPTRRQHLSRPQRYCSKICANTAHTARKRADRPPQEPRPPKITPLPPFDFSKGTCTHVPPSQQLWWTSDNPVLREGAANICGVCPIVHLCLEWSLDLPRDDNSIYAGLGRAERRELRRMIRDQR